MPKNITIIDLSMPLGNSIPDGQAMSVVYTTHQENARARAAQWGFRVEDLPEPGITTANETVTASPHAATHLDAPYHFGPTCAGQPARTIDQVPLEWCYGDGVLLDFHDKGPGESITPGDVQDRLRNIGYTLKPGDIILFRTDWDKKVHLPNAGELQPAILVETTEWLLDQGIRTLAIDAPSFDLPGAVSIRNLLRGDKEQFFPSHNLGRRREYIHAEKLANLDALPWPFGFRVALFPVKIERASGGWCRAVAIFEEE